MKKLLGYLFGLLWAIPSYATLPTGYTELEYIESTGTQYIQTSVYGATGLSVELVAQGTGDRGVIFSFDQDYSGSYVGDNGSVFRAPNTFTDAPSLTKTKITTSWETDTSGLKQTTVINGSTITYNNYTRTPSQISIFRGTSWTAADSYWAGKIFSFSANKDNTPVLNLIPAKRNSDSAIGMYNTVTNTFFTNAGTGSFIAGPVAEIKIATTKYVDDEFAPLNTALANAISVVDNVVTQTIAQAEQIATLQNTKQTRPSDDNECPAGKKCLLVTDETGTPHWYPIVESILPDAYTQLEYIGFDGRNALATGVSVLETDRVIIDANISGPQAGSSDNFMLDGGYSWIDVYSSNVWYVRFGSTSSANKTIGSDEIGQRNIYELYKGHFDINGVTKLTPVYSEVSGNWTINRIATGSTSVCAKGNYYRITIKNDITGEIRFNGIPAKRNSDNVVGMYDTVSGTFFENAGTGSFVAGPTVF